MDNSTILVIPDIQAPFHHQDCIPFLREIKKQLKPTRIIQGGDLYDFHCFSDYDKNPDLPGTQEEIKLLKSFIKEIGKLFPVMDILDSNHGNRIRRKAMRAGLPESFLRDELSILEAPRDWKLHSKLYIKTSHGNQVLFVHNYSSNVLNSSKDMASSLVQFHFHSKYETHYWSNGKQMFFATTAGCLIDPESKAFSYNFTQSKRPCLGALVIKGMCVIHIPMILNKSNRWVGYL
jgi:hypothetical protein